MDLNLAEITNTIPSNASRFFEWFSSDFIFVVILAFINIVLLVLFFKTRISIRALYTDPLKTIFGQKKPGVKSDRKANPIRMQDGLID